MKTHPCANVMPKAELLVKVIHATFEEVLRQGTEQ